jgi:Cyclin, N-terminal domain
MSNGTTVIKAEAPDDAGLSGTIDERQAQWLFNRDDWKWTPSVQKAGYTIQEERITRAKAINVLLRISDYLRLPLHVSTAASIFFHRFYMRESLPPKDSGRRLERVFPPEEVAATCVFLASKTEECPKKLVHVIEAVMAALDPSPDGQRAFSERTYARVFGRARRRKDTGEVYDYRMPIDEEDAHAGRGAKLPGVKWKNAILSTEMWLAQTLCFDFVVEYPIERLLIAAKVLGIHHNIFLACWFCLTDT